ncbi:MAG: hypothetical protein A3D27_01115 [Omnitrophica WOR_2 bacterium RIFCSPHIGHO2_02_FULL_46_37]|nr:MAG: hypothetical protein A3D27_01115 [Omnitrophica WOR_2 bacterium RIFCSPHIGHO2_02_FULL_46_37]OGX43847.1 MAG: hypothetical protein A3H41_00500 [Omnitrophica WOR_2 bacterium RIFCSPLOWO2_02_FULL_45_28]
MAKRILVIDDSRLNLGIISQALSQAGFEVATANNGNEELEKFKKEKIDLVILDLILPGLDGFGFLQICKNDPLIKHIPVIVLTGRDSLEEIEKTKRLGALECFVKHRMPPNKIKDYIKSYFNQWK